MQDTLKPEVVKDSTDLVVDTAVKVVDTVATVADTLGSSASMNCPAIQGNYMWVIDNKEPATVLCMPEGLASIVIPTGIAVLIFFAGLFANWWSNKLKRKEEIETTIAVVTKWIELLKEPIDLQMKHLSMFTTTIKQNRNIAPEFLGVTRLLASKLDSINIDKYINSR